MRSDPKNDYRSYNGPVAPTRLTKEGAARLLARAEYWRWRGLVEEDIEYGTSNTPDGLRRTDELEGVAEILRSLDDDPDDDE